MTNQIDVNELKQFIDFVSNKEQSGNSYTPDQFDLMMKRGTHDIVRWLFGLVHQYRPGFPVPSIAYEVSQKVKDDLRHLKKIVRITVDSHGVAVLPDDYLHKTAIAYLHKKNIPNCPPEVKPLGVEVVEDEKWADRCSNAIKGPTKRHPICRFDADTLLVRPMDLKEIELSYIAQPEDPKWGFYIDEESDDPIYKESESVHIQLPYILLNDLARIILSYMGINLREPQLQQYAEMVKDEGV